MPLVADATGFFFGFLRLSQFALPFAAIEQTATSDLNAYTLYTLWSLSFLRSFGYDFIDLNFGKIDSILFLGVLLLKTSASVNHDGTALAWWLAVVAFELFFDLLSWFTAGGHRRLVNPNLLPPEEKAHNPSYFATFSAFFSSGDNKQQNRRGDDVTWSALFGVLLTVAVFQGTRAGVFYDTVYNTDLPWYDDSTTPANIELFIFGVDYALLCLLGLRARAYVSHLSAQNDNSVLPSFVVHFCGPFYLWLFYGLAQFWIIGSIDKGLLIAECLAVFAALSLCYEGEISNGKLPWYDDLQLLFVETLWVVLQFLFTPLAIQLIYLVLCGVLLYTSGSVWFNSVQSFPAAVVAPSCASLSAADNAAYGLLAVQSYDDSLIGENLVALRLMLARFAQDVYPYVSIGCYGAATAMAPNNNLLVLWFALISTYPAFFIVTQVFDESQYVIQRAGFWAVAAVVSLVSLLTTQLASDGDVTVWGFLVQSSYARSYTSTGMAVMAAQIVMVLAPAVLWIESNARRAPAKLRLFHRAAMLAERLLTPGPWFLLGALVWLVYAVANQSPVSHADLLKIQLPDVPPWSMYEQADNLTSLATTNIAAMVQQQAAIDVGSLDLAAYLTTALSAYSTVSGYCGACPALPTVTISGTSTALCTLVTPSCTTLTASGLTGGGAPPLATALNASGTALALVLQTSAVNLALANASALAPYEFFDVIDQPGFAYGSVLWPAWLYGVAAAGLFLFLCACVALAIEDGRHFVLGIFYLAGGLVLSFLASVALFVVVAYLGVQRFGYTLDIGFDTGTYNYLGALILYYVGSTLLEARAEMNGEDVPPPATATKARAAYARVTRHMYS